MKKYGVLIVDDSAFMRRAIGLLIEKDPSFYIAGIARNGLEAIEKSVRFEPDVITMDVEMPGMDGIAALEKIMSEHPMPVVMLSNHTGEGAQAAVRALELGAVDVFRKDALLADVPEAGALAAFHARLRSAAEARVTSRIRFADCADSVAERSSAAARPTRGSAGPDLIVICSSTGGPSALQAILPRFPRDCPAGIIVVQHMPPGFTGPLADRFNHMCELAVKEAEEGDPLMPGTIYFAPAGYQTTALRRPDGRVVLHVDEEPAALYKPSVDVTLRSLAPIYRNKMLSAILTGMGDDGLEGCRAVKEHGGLVLTEAESSCIVYGMPKAVYEAGLADAQAALPRMFAKIMSYLE